jgi:hypothetical protein
MNIDDDWITKRINAALHAQPVADAIASAIKNHLRGAMRERALKPAELAKTANSLLTQVGDPPAKESAQ